METELQDPLLADGYVEYERWEINDVLGFVRRELETPDWTLQLMLTSLLALVVFGLTAAYWDIEDSARWFMDIVLPFAVGCGLMLAAVIPHELLHGIAYKIVGANRVAYGGSLRQMIFHASAPYHVLTAKQLYFVAMTPFVVINTLIVLGLFTLQGPIWWALFGLLLMHTQGCVGDFAMVSFFNRNRNQGHWLTYDASDTQEFVLLVKTAKSRNGLTRNSNADIP